MRAQKLRAAFRVRKTSGAKLNRNARERKNLHLHEQRAANHLALIRSFLIDSGRWCAWREPIYAKNYCGAFAPHAIDIDEKFAAHARDFYCCAALAGKYRRCKKSLFYRAFCNVCDRRHRRCLAFTQRNIARNERGIDDAPHVLRASDTHIVKWSQCFFHCAVVNGMQCVSIPERTDATPAMLHG